MKAYSKNNKYGKVTFYLNKRNIAVFFILLFNSQLFYGSAGNPFGVKGLQELFSLFLILWVILSIAIQQVSNGRVRKLDVYVLLLVILPSIYGSLIAQLSYGQPIIFGLIEERRILAVLVYFPIRDMLEHNWINIINFEKYIAICATICASLSVGTFLDIVPTFQEIIISEIALRQMRIAVGPAWIALSIPFILTSKSQFISKLRIPLLILTIGTMIVIIQSRQLIIITVITSLFVLRGQNAIFFVIVVILTLFVAFYTIPSINSRILVILQMLEQLASSSYSEKDWRVQSYQHVFRFWSEQKFGHGSLSLLWQNGFKRVIGDFFFLADIGISGTLFRYGIPGLVLYLFWGINQFNLLRAIKNPHNRTLMGALFLYLIIGMPVGAPLEYRGYISGMLLGVTGYLANFDKKV